MLNQLHKVPISSTALLCNYSAYHFLANNNILLTLHGPGCVSELELAVLIRLVLPSRDKSIHQTQYIHNMFILSSSMIHSHRY